MTETDTHYYDPTIGHGLPHDPFKALVGPRPIGWISSCDEQGRVNLAPYSFFNAFCAAPPIVGFASTGWKDSIRNIDKTGEFVVNLATRKLANAMNLSSVPVPSDVDEFAVAGLKAAPCESVRPPRVEASPAALECRCVQILPLVGLDGAVIDSWLVLGQVVGVHIRKEYLRDGLFDVSAAGVILRAGYVADYAQIIPESVFRMPRPKI